MKKRRWGVWIALIITAVLLCTVAGVAYWQKNNIAALVNFMRYDETQLEEKMVESKKTVDEVVQSYEIDDLRDLTPEEEEKLREGKITVEEAFALMREPKTPEADTPPKSTASPEASSSSKTDPARGEKEIVSDYVGQMYRLKAEFIGKLGAAERRAIAEYRALTPEQKKTSKQSLITKYLGEGNALERSCDARVAEVLKNMTAELKGVNGDLSIIKTIQKAYDDEKMLKKSYYLSNYSAAF